MSIFGKLFAPTSTSKLSFPKYYCFGNGCDMWSIDILHGKGKSENLAHFRVEKSEKGLIINKITPNNPSKKFPVTSLKSSQLAPDNISTQVAYCEAGILAREYARKMEAKEQAD